MKLIVLFAAVVSVVFQAVFAESCISAAVKEELTNDVLQKARETSLSDSSVRCLQEYAQSFKPIEGTVSDGSKTCYDQKGFGMHMAHAIRPCIHEIGESHKFGEVREVAIKKAHATMQLGDSVGKGVVRMGKKKRRGRKQICKRKSLRRKGEKCTCTNGCHYCCIISMLGGNNFCFQLYCNGRGCCPSMNGPMTGSMD